MNHPAPHAFEPKLADLLAERYGKELGSAYDVIDNTITRHVLNHRSIRTFAPRPLPDNVLPTLVAAAQSASSSSNLQVWSVVAIRDPEHKARLTVGAKNETFVRQAPLLLVWLADFARAHQVAQQHDRAIDGADFVESVIMGAVDTALAAQNAVLAAESLGLGAVYIGGLRSHVRAIAADLKLPPHVFPVFGMAIGYPAEATPAFIKPRLPQQAVLHLEHYNAGPQLEAVEAYDQALDAFWRQQSIEHPAWSKQMLGRLTANTKDQRYALNEILRELGFALR